MFHKGPYLVPFFVLLDGAISFQDYSLGRSANFDNFFPSENAVKLEFMLEVTMSSYRQIGNSLPVTYEALWAEMAFGVNNSV